MLGALNRFCNRLYALCAWLAAALFIILCLLVLYSIAARIFGFFGGGATDAAGYVMVAATFLALAPTFRARGHIYVSLLVARLPPRWRWRMALFSHAVMLMTVSYLAFYLSRLAYFSYRFEERSEGADAVLLWIPQLPVAIGAIIFAIAVLHGGLCVFLGGVENGEGEENEIPEERK